MQVREEGKLASSQWSLKRVQIGGLGKQPSRFERDRGGKKLPSIIVKQATTKRPRLRTAAENLVVVQA